MSVEFRLPDNGEGVEEVEIVRWLVQEGEHVQQSDPIVEVQTNKALVELPAPEAGYIGEIVAPSGVLVRVGDLLALIEERPLTHRTAHPPMEGANESSDGDDVQDPGDATDTAVKTELTPGVEAVRRPKATPAVRNYARELGVSLRDIRGSGPGGRILRTDIDRYVETLKAVEKSRKTRVLGPDDDDSVLWSIARKDPSRVFKRGPSRPSGGLAGDVSVTGGNYDGDEQDDSLSRPLYLNEAKSANDPVLSSTRVPFRGLRRATAENVKRSAFSAPHVTSFDECDAGNLVELKNRWNDELEQEGQRLSYLPFIVKATVSALKKFPYFNARLHEDAQEIELFSSYNIGIAVDTADGLVVPVIKHADQLSVRELGQEVFRLSTQARNRTLSPEDLKGSTFSITNMGPIGGMFVTPILHYPEVGILAVHPIQRKPVVRGEQIVIGEVLPMSLSFDHRVIDGVTSIRFMNHLKRIIEQPDLLMLELR